MLFDYFCMYVFTGEVMSNFKETRGGLMNIIIYLFDYINCIIFGVLTRVVISAIFIIRRKIWCHKHLLNVNLLEIIWTMLPVVILIILAIPSLHLLYLIDEEINAKETVKAMGHQWYWSYERALLQFDSYITKSDDLLKGEFALLEVDNRLFLPFNSCTRLFVSSTDVIHSWSMPSIGLKVDAVPGRLNQLNLFRDKPGVFFGQCSEICGANHSFIPIVVEII